MPISPTLDLRGLARVLGTDRAAAAAFARSTAGFPPPEETDGRPKWDRKAVFAWLVANDDPGLPVYEPPFDEFDQMLLPIMSQAAKEAFVLGHHWMGGEHLAIALCTDAGGRAQIALAMAKTSEDNVRKAVATASSTEGEPFDHVRSTSLSRTLAALSAGHAADLCDAEVGGEHLLLAMLGYHENLGSDLLRHASEQALTFPFAAASVERQLWGEASASQT